MPRISFEQIPAGLMSCMMETERYVSQQAIIDDSLMELLRYYVSVLNGCAYCIDMHYKEAVAAGESEQRLYSVTVWRETDFYNEREQALLGWAEVVTQLDDSTPRAFDALSQYFDVAEIANITLAITQINAWNRMAISFQFPPGSYTVGQFQS